MQQSSAAPSDVRQKIVQGGAVHTASRRQLPAIIFEGTLTGASAARILSQRGIRTYSVMNDPGIYRHSRYYHAAPGLHGRTSAEKITTFLAQLELPAAVLIPCADDWVRAVSTLNLGDAGRFSACVPPIEAIETVIDKWKFAQLVDRLDVPHPRTRMIGSLERLQDLTEEDFRGYFLKPINSLEFTRRHGVKALLVQDKAGALSKASGIDYPIMLQEYIPGPATNHYFIDGFIDRHGKTCALFARRRLRMYPPKVGNSSLLTSIPVQQIQPAADSLRYMLETLHYRGIFSAEFKYDERDGKYKILEVNARPWWYIEFAARCGIDVCTMAYLDALGIDVKPVFDYRLRRRCVHLSNDIAGFRHKADGFPRSFFSWAKSVIGAYDAIFRWSDPGPSIASNFSLIARRWRTK